MKILHFIASICLSFLIVYIVYISKIFDTPFGYWWIGLVSGHIIGFADHVIWRNRNKIKETHSEG